jgi:hypothetical protein
MPKLLVVLLSIPFFAQGVTWNGQPNTKAIVDLTLGKSCAVSTNQFPVGRKVWVCDMNGTDGPCQVAVVAAPNNRKGEVGISDKVFKVERDDRLIVRTWTWNGKKYTYGGAKSANRPFWVRLESFDGDDIWSSGFYKKTDRPLCYVPPCGICGAVGFAGPIGPDKK